MKPRRWRHRCLTSKRLLEYLLVMCHTMLWLNKWYLVLFCKYVPYSDFKRKRWSEFLISPVIDADIRDNGLWSVIPSSPIAPLLLNSALNVSRNDSNLYLISCFFFYRVPSYAGVSALLRSHSWTSSLETQRISWITFVGRILVCSKIQWSLTNDFFYIDCPVPNKTKMRPPLFFT